MIDIESIKEKKSTEELLEFGIINIDKPSGPTSFDASEFVKKALGLRKTSHFGTLDPKVTGVLPVALNRACKLTGFFLGEDKEYVGIMRLHEDISMEKLKEALKKFTGKIIQKPPVKSRVARIEREREVKSFKILEKEGKDILFTAEVQGGTYIRKLVHDLGETLGSGAHMTELRRTRAGIFKEEDEKYPGISLYEFEKAADEYKNGNEELLKKAVIPGEAISELYPVAEIKEESAEKILRGQPVYLKDLVKEAKTEKNGLICIFSNDKFIGIYRVVSEDRVFARPEFVLQPIK